MVKSLILGEFKPKKNFSNGKVFASHFHLKHLLRPHLSREKFKVLFKVLCLPRMNLFGQKAPCKAKIFRPASQCPDGSWPWAPRQVEREWWELPFKGKLLLLFQLVRSLMEEIRFQKLFEWREQENFTKRGLQKRPGVAWTWEKTSRQCQRDKVSPCKEKCEECMKRWWENYRGETAWPVFFVTLWRLFATQNAKFAYTSSVRLTSSRFSELLLNFSNWIPLKAIFTAIWQHDWELVSMLRFSKRRVGRAFSFIQSFSNLMQNEWTFIRKQLLG